jgi:hypothetical protein
MLDTLDDGLQRLVILTVYGEEIWVLPLTAAIIAVTKGRTWAIPVRIALLLLLLIYVVVFRMHWHSWLAVPILALVIASDVGRDHWYRLLGGLRAAWTERTEASSAGKRRKLRYRPVVLLFQVAAVVATFFYFDAPGDLWAIGAAAIVLAALFGLLPAWRRIAETRFQQELQQDPRLGRYLDWVRMTRIRAAADRKSLLAENWVARRRSHVAPRGVRLRLARFILRPRRMLSIESTFVIQNLRREREQAWQALQVVLHGAAADRPGTASPPMLAIGDILASQNGQAALANWLAMTEALAECLAFANDRPGDNAGERPQWLAASELLAHAAEVEQEIVLDLKREARASREPAGDDAKSRIAEHQARASRYFDLAACCVENHLEPGTGVAGAPIEARWRRVVGRRMWWRPQSIADPKVAEEALWRIVLALRYQILDTLSQSKSDLPKLRPAVTLFRGDIGPDPSTPLLVAALARDAAESGLWISAHQGDPSSRWAFDDRRPWVDRLKQFDYWQARLHRDGTADEHSIIAASALRRVLHLWGIAIEQDLDVLRWGTEIWRDRLESAADYFIYEGSLRVRRLAALAERQSQSPAVFDQVVELI